MKRLNICLGAMVLGLAGCVVTQPTPRVKPIPVPTPVPYPVPVPQPCPGPCPCPPRVEVG
jgi:hypothetical protein